MKSVKKYQYQPEHIAMVTGTNGKSSVVIWTQYLLESAGGGGAVSLGTLGLRDGQGESMEIEKGHLTTPDGRVLERIARALKRKGVSYLVLEASSHGLDQRRIDGLTCEVGAFTNFESEHLDYHGTKEEYFQSKLRLFQEVVRWGGVAVLPKGSPYFSVLKEESERRQLFVMEYGGIWEGVRGSFVWGNVEEGRYRAEVSVGGKVYGSFMNVRTDWEAQNALCALGITLGLLFEEGVVERVMEAVRTFPQVEGRLERMHEVSDPWKVYVDYAHTPDAMELVLKAGKRWAGKKGRVSVVFGCGGQRDESNRVRMGKVVQAYAQRVYVTNDNPRDEDPGSIRRTILGVCRKGVEIPDRGEAIRQAIEDLQGGDLLVVAGKGHEKVQIIGDKVLDFQDGVVVKECLKNKRQSSGGGKR